MHRPKPRHATLDEVKIDRQGEYAEITFADETRKSMNIKIGPELSVMSDEEVLDVYNGIVSAMEESVRNWENVVVEVPPGKPQIKYFEEGDQWTPRGEVLRVYISEPEWGKMEFYVDDQVLSLEQFGRMLSTFNGWAMRIAFVPEEFIEENPRIELRDPVD